MKGITNVLSLFDGISCGQLALEKAYIPYSAYYASEIDKYSISVTQRAYPNTIQLGDIKTLDIDNLPTIDLLLAGFPCQSFSFAGDMRGFDDQRGSLFFHCIYALKALKPKYFLFENVKMKGAYRDEISKLVGVEPILINSNLVSAQNRPRLYWTNIPGIVQPHDVGVLIEDILEDDVHGFELSGNSVTTYDLEKYYHSNIVANFTERRTEESKRIRREHMKTHGKDWSPRRGKELTPRTDGKVNCLTTGLTKEHIVIDKKGEIRWLTPLEFERLQCIPDGYTVGGTNGQRYKALGNGWTVDVISHIVAQNKHS